MKPEEYPSNVILAQNLTKFLGTKVESDILRIQGKMGENTTIQIVTGLTCVVKYKKPEETSGTITVTIKPKKGKEKELEKEFDTTMDMQDIGDISGHFHVLPIHAFKSAVAEILKQ